MKKALVLVVDVLLINCALALSISVSGQITVVPSAQLQCIIKKSIGQAFGIFFDCGNAGLNINDVSLHV